jgi:hypothetical protein
VLANDALGIRAAPDLGHVDDSDWDPGAGERAASFEPPHCRLRCSLQRPTVLIGRPGLMNE